MKPDAYCQVYCSRIVKVGECTDYRPKAMVRGLTVVLEPTGNLGKDRTLSTRVGTAVG